MLLSLDETLKEHLNILNSFDETVVAEFCKIAINFLNKGGKVGEKSLQSAASKLGLETKQIKDAVEALAHVLVLCAGGELDSADVVDSFLTAGLDAEVAQAVEKCFVENRTFLRDAVVEAAAESGPAGDIPHYQDFEWRIQVEIGSRALRNQFVPKVLCKLKTTTSRRSADGVDADEDVDEEEGRGAGDNGTEVVQSRLLEIPPRDLLHITQTLDEALRVARSSRCRRIMRSVT